MPKPFQHLKLSNPLAIIDLETTGVDPRVDRIIEVGVLRFETDVEPVRYHRLLNPGVLIPAAATAVHGITDTDVAGKPKFRTIAPRLARFLVDCDLAGFGLKRFDLPFLLAEFTRVGIEFPLADRSVLDVMQIFHNREPRDLSAAVQFYLGRDHDEAHSAMADAQATAAILDAQVARYNLPSPVAWLHEMFTDVDIAGWFRSEEGRIIFAFGKHVGRALDQVARDDPGYLRWMLNQDFFDDVVELVERALARAVP